MQFLASSLVVLLCALLGHSQAAAANANCRNVPGSPGYPTAAEWDALNATVSGKLVTVIPSAKFCTNLPGGAMDQLNWEQNITFNDSFFTGSNHMGSTITLGSGIYAQALHERGKANGKIAVGPTAATVCPGAGWVQGAGHSALAPTFGLGADNALEFEIVVASGELLKFSHLHFLEHELNNFHPMFYALRGGGAGSWGVVVSVTFQAYPTFNATSSLIILVAENDNVASSLATLHAQHIFDWDSVHAGQPFLNASLAFPGVLLYSQEFTYGDINDALYQAGDSGATAILGHLVAGGKVATNAKILSAIHRTAKAHVIVTADWDDSASLVEINHIRHFFQKVQVPIFDEMTGHNAEAYSHEADVLEPHFQTTFFGPNYAKLSATTHPALNRFLLPSQEYVSCVSWNGLYYITGTDIVRLLAFWFEAFSRPVRNLKKFEEGVFSDLRSLKPGVDACLEEPQSPLLNLLFAYQCIRTKNRQKMFYWYSVPHDRLFLEALERDLKREAVGLEPTTQVTGEPALSFIWDGKQSLYELFIANRDVTRLDDDNMDSGSDTFTHDDAVSLFAMFSLSEGRPT
ncbi:hypothetical protein MSAN_00524300 [Mycena sanguinolenta]|uniref:FAD-binding PCMH-type domain-containing protein n=1 Tax=Mycena sanguinolenta TaxID=230812 RepID=A0A8H6Z9A2_9AGAR|nr:hypothetical protein MSAN_00524300 [Mycena sanguinolenta]